MIFQEVSYLPRVKVPLALLAECSFFCAGEIDHQVTHRQKSQATNDDDSFWIPPNELNRTRKGDSKGDQQVAQFRREIHRLYRMHGLSAIRSLGQCLLYQTAHLLGRYNRLHLPG